MRLVGNGHSPVEGPPASHHKLSAGRVPGAVPFYVEVVDRAVLTLLRQFDDRDVPPMGPPKRIVHKSVIRMQHDGLDRDLFDALVFATLSLGDAVLAQIDRVSNPKERRAMRGGQDPAPPNKYASAPGTSA